MSGAWSAGSNRVGAGVVWMWGGDACVALCWISVACGDACVDPDVVPRATEPCVIQIPPAVCAQTQTTRRAGALAHYRPAY